MWLHEASKRQTPSSRWQGLGLVVGRAGTWFLADGAHEVVEPVFGQRPIIRSSVSVMSPREPAVVCSSVCGFPFLIS